MRSPLAALVFLAALLLAAAPAQGAGRCGTAPWCDTSLSPDKRAELLVGQLTLAETS